MSHDEQQHELDRLWAEAEALRAALTAVQREIDAGRGISEETATGIDALLTPNAKLTGSGTESG
jgi:alkylation response protein AidB-like acyl-CoA dehydrogenase